MLCWVNEERKSLKIDIVWIEILLWILIGNLKRVSESCLKVCVEYMNGNGKFVFINDVIWIM